jgi:hypothetical protein
MRNVWSLTDFRHGFYWKVEKDGVHIAFLIVSLWLFVWVPMWWQMQKIWKFGLLILVAASEVLLVCNSVFHHQTSHSVCLTLCLESQQNTGRRDFLESKRDAHILLHTCTCTCMHRGPAHALLMKISPDDLLWPGSQTRIAISWETHGGYGASR